MRRVTDDFGILLSVGGRREVGFDGDGVQKFEEITLEFAHGRLSVLAVGADDSIEITESKRPSGAQADLSATDVWQQALGSRAIWTWSMRNQQGFHDGFQIEFSRPGIQCDIQFMVEASTLSVRKVA